MSDSISVRQGSQIVPIVDHVVRRPPGLAERGVLVEHHAIGPTEFPERETLQHNFFMHTGPAVQAEIKSSVFSGRRWIRPGALWVMPQGCRREVRFEGVVEGMALAFDPVRFDILVESSGGKCSTQMFQSLVASPPKIELLMRALALGSKSPSSHGHLGLECIATAIALAQSQHAGIATTSSKTGPRLAPRQIRAVQSYVPEHLDQPIALAELAAAAWLSSFHFLRAFRQSLGVTPGQYVLDCRMERARALLEDSDLSVAEVALRLGFDYPGHFSRAFRRAVGTSPSMFRASFKIKAINVIARRNPVTTHPGIQLMLYVYAVVGTHYPRRRGASLPAPGCMNGEEALMFQRTRAKNRALVHGVNGGGSSWSGAIPLPRAAGCKVTSVQKPLKCEAQPVEQRQRDMVRLAAIRKLRADPRGIYGSLRLTATASAAGIRVGCHLDGMMRRKGLGRRWAANAFSGTFLGKQHAVSAQASGLDEPHLLSSRPGLERSVGGGG